MRLELLSVALRQRDPWEAMDLGIALWRRHFGAILRPWLLLSLPVFALVNLLGWRLDAMWLGPLLMWWLKPWFDRVPLYVLSRAVFGTVPGARQVLRARELYSPGLLPWLSWRRFHPARALLLPVDLLEGASGARRGQRGVVLLRAASSQALGLLACCLCFEAMIAFSVVAVGLLFVPTEFLSESARAVWATLFQSPPRWAQLFAVGIHWLAVSITEPLYVAAGFGLYLNRRTQLEAWDVELVFRRLAARAQAAAAAVASAAVLLLLLATLFAPAPAFAAEPPPPQAKLTPVQLLGAAARPADPAFERALERAYANPSLARSRQVTHWQLRSFLPERKPEQRTAPGWLQLLAGILGAIGEYGLWILVALLLLFLLWRLPRWLPWVRSQIRVEPPLPQLVEQAVPELAPLPGDIPAAASALWREGRHRDALALLYRASVARLAERLGASFPPGATEADCLRRARKIEDPEARNAFAEVVRTWQRAAYARQFPDADTFAALLERWSLRFPVSA